MSESLENGLERLQKVLARAGIASRRACEELIAAGRVKVNGKTVTQLGTKIDPATDKVMVDDHPVPVRADATPRKIYLALNKPEGYLSTVSDPQGRPTIMDLVDTEQRLFPVGRLDMETEGLLILTNDGAFANTLLHPRYGVEKEYVALLDGFPRLNKLDDLRKGIEIPVEDPDTGERTRQKTLPARVEFIRREGSNTLVKFGLKEGKKRQVRLMADAIGHPVIKLTRVAFGSLKLGDLPPGKSRRLSNDEVKSLLKEANEGAPEAKPAEKKRVVRPRPAPRERNFRDFSGEREPERGYGRRGPYQDSERREPERRPGPGRPFDREGRGFSPERRPERGFRRGEPFEGAREEEQGRRRGPGRPFERGNRDYAGDRTEREPRRRGPYQEFEGREPGRGGGSGRPFERRERDFSREEQPERGYGRRGPYQDSERREPERRPGPGRPFERGGRDFRGEDRPERDNRRRGPYQESGDRDTGRRPGPGRPPGRERGDRGAPFQREEGRRGNFSGPPSRGGERGNGPARSGPPRGRFSPEPPPTPRRSPRPGPRGRTDGRPPESGPGRGRRS